MPSTSSYAVNPPLDHVSELANLTRLAKTMDSAFKLPVINRRIGWDSIIGLVPVVGDTVALMPAAYILYKGWQMGASNWLLARMAANVGIDYAVGSVPLIGDILDIGFKANRRNVELLHGLKGLPSPFATPADRF